MAAKRGTYLVELSDGKEIIFGNNYKHWWEHAREFIYREYGDPKLGWRYEDIAGKVISVSYSNQPFYDDGGLKWCDKTAYQELIDEVCEKRKLVKINSYDIVFEESPADKSVLTKKLKEY